MKRFFYVSLFHLLTLFKRMIKQTVLCMYIIQTAVEVQRAIPSLATEEWVSLFGKEDELNNVEFTGFTRDEMYTLSYAP